MAHLSKGRKVNLFLHANCVPLLSQLQGSELKCRCGVFENIHWQSASYQMKYDKGSHIIIIVGGDWLKSWLFQPIILRFEICRTAKFIYTRYFRKVASIFHFFSDVHQASERCKRVRLWIMNVCSESVVVGRFSLLSNLESNSFDSRNFFIFRTALTRAFFEFTRQFVLIDSKS